MKMEFNTMKLIGKGTFTKAYLKDDGKTVLLRSIDPIKECMALGWFPAHKLFPAINRTDNDEEYEMMYYPRTSSLKKALKPAQWELYKELRCIAHKIHLDIINTKNKRYTLDIVRNNFKTMKSKTLSRIMIDAVEACANYGQDIRFEISPCNVRTHKGNLILLDCFFIWSKLQEVQNEQKRRLKY